MQQFNVVMLPTEKASQLYIPNTGQLELGFNIQRTLPDVSQHLYITEPNATIEEGDWCVKENTLFKCKEVSLSGFITDEEGYLHNKTTWSNKVVVSKIIATTDPELGLPLCNDDFIQAFVKYGKDLVITNVEVNKYNDICYVHWVYRPSKVTYQNVDLSSELVKSVQSGKAIEHNLQVPSYENNKDKEFPQSSEQLLDEILNEDFEVVITTKPLPKTQQEFIALLNQQVEGWVFTGSNPFSKANLKSNRLWLALRKMALELFDSEYLSELEDLWESIKTYEYRNLPLTASKEGWSVCGIDTVDGGSGVLEWCYNYEDAKNRFDIMSQYKQFTDLSIYCIKDVKTKPNYNGVKIDFIWLCECAKQYTPNEELELLKERINNLKQFFNDPEIVSIINR